MKLFILILVTFFIFSDVFLLTNSLEDAEILREETTKPPRKTILRPCFYKICNMYRRPRQEPRRLLPMLNVLSHPRQRRAFPTQ
nr:BLTX447 [Nephila pilipes]